MKRLLLLLGGGFVALSLPSVAAPLDSPIIYQGSLSENGQPANGTYDLRLSLYDAQEGGTPAWPILTNSNVAVTAGLIRTTMDFGAEPFDGTALWLEIGVRPGGSEDPFVTLSPRQPLLAAPYAVHALSAGTVPDGSLTGETLAEGQVVRSMNGLTDHVEVVAGTNITVSLEGSTLTLSATVAEGPPGPIGPQGPQGEPGDSLWSLSGADLSYLTGKVGIGTSTPAALIHAHGAPVANRGQLSLSSPPGQDAILSLYDADIFAGYLWYDPTAQDLRLQNVRAGDLNLNPFGGNVGIGANNPNAKLHVAGAVAIGDTTDASPPAGTIRWTGTDFEGYSGTGWVSLTGSSADAWSLKGNAGTDPSVNFVGTLDNRPLELRVNGYRALRLEYAVHTDGLVNVIAGNQSNGIETGYRGAVISGGATNSIASWTGTESEFEREFSVIAGGSNNRNALGYSVIAGGSYNSMYSFSGGASGHNTINGGGSNTIWSGGINHSSWNVICGGSDNVSYGGLWDVICGGSGNRTGQDDFGPSAFNSIVGGVGNECFQSGDTVIVGGRGNQIHGGTADTIGGGEGNFIRGNAEGLFLPAGPNSVICGGHSNSIWTAECAVVAGGSENSIGPVSEYAHNESGEPIILAGASIVGGFGNSVFSPFGVIAGGSDNQVSTNSAYSVILGGLSNVASGIHALAAGRRAMALHDGAFVWGDSTDADVESSAANEFTIRASGGVRFFSSSDLSAGVTLAPGDGSWASVSDRDAKRDFEPIDGLAVLEKVAALPLSTWSYKTQGASVRHIGPMAQDFHAAFGVGADDKRITSVDADGVALAAIQGLNQKLTAKETEIADLRQQNTELEHRLAALEQIVAGLSSRGMVSR